MKHFYQFRLGVAVALALALLAGCRKPHKTVTPKVTLLDSQTTVTHDAAHLYAKVDDNGGANVLKCGFCFGKTTCSDTVFGELQSGSFSCHLTGLASNQRYVCKAFAQNKAGYGWSDDYVFTTATEPHGIAVTTHMASSITTTTAFVGGHVKSLDGSTANERGVCYSTDGQPTIDDTRLVIGSGVGEFADTLHGLTPNTMYHCRAYAVGSDGVVYGSEQLFMTLLEPMAVQTESVTDIVSTRVRCEGYVIRDGGHEVTERGFCWSTEPNPTLENLHVLAGTGTGAFVGYLSGLQQGETYHVRAYAVNEAGVVYGKDLSFVTNSTDISWPNGILPGMFSVSDSTRVRFSQGNLQYKPYLNQWRFAECQWDFVGGDIPAYTTGTVYDNGVKCDNARAGFTYNGWIDLFGWGTSGWNNGNQYYKPWNYMANEVFNPYYGPYGNHDLTGEFAHADWGVHNHISNGGWVQWHTPTFEEFEYLLETRSTPSGIRYAKATISGIFGLILLPDDWNDSNYPLNDANMPMANPFANIISAMEWVDILEPAGAVFLPAAGARLSGYSYADGYYHSYYENYATFVFLDYGRANSMGSYWTVTQGIGMNCASALGIWDYYMGMSIEEGRSTGYSVRLVIQE